MKDNWPGAEWWAEPSREYLPIIMLLIYGGGTIAFPIVLAIQGRLGELFSCSTFIVYCWGLLASLFSIFMLVTVYRARAYMRNNDQKNN